MFYFLPFHPFFPFTPFLSFILLSFTHSPPHFSSPSHFNNITDSNYFAQMTQLTLQSITITKQKLKPHISCTVVKDIHSNQEVSCEVCGTIGVVP